MTRKNVLMMLPVIFSILLMSNFGMVFASHGELSGSGCSGDCVPPTLGQDSSGVVFVEGGLTINDQIFDVDHYKQNISTQIIHENEPVEIVLRVFENGGPDNLNHVSLAMANEYKFDSYVWTETSNAEIIWEKTFDGIESVEINNPKNLITDVSVNTEIDGQITILNFQFTPTTTFDASNIKVKMWDHGKSFWQNSFYDAFEIQSDPLLTMSDTVF